MQREGKTDDLKDSIILAVLDYLDRKSSVTDAEAEQLRMDAARTVSQVLLNSTEAREISRSSSSLARGTDRDSMLESQSGFPTSTLHSVLDSASQDIIQNVEGHRNLSAYKNFILFRLMERTTKKVKAFLEVSTALVKESQEPPSAPHPSGMDDLTMRCTNDIIDGIIQACRPHGGGESNQLSEVMQELEIIVSSRRSSSRKDVEVVDLEESQETSHLLSDGFHQNVKRVISDALLKTTGAVSAPLHTSMDDLIVEDLEMEPSDSSFESSLLIEAAVSDLAEGVIEDLEKVSSHQVDEGSAPEPAASRKTLRSAARRLYRNVHFKVFGFLLRLQESRSSSVSNQDKSTTGEDQESGSVLRAGHTPPSTREREACFSEELIEDLLSLLDSSHTIEDRTRDYLTRECESPGLASTAWNRADDYDPEEQKTHSSSSRQVENHVPVDADPGTGNKIGLGIRKHLRRAFSAIRRALPNPFQCMSGPP